MYDISRLIVGILVGFFIVFGLYYGMKLRREYPDQNPRIDTKTSDLQSSPLNPITSKVIDIISSNPQLTTFAKYASNINLQQEFEDKDRITIFVPSDKAFESYVKDNLINENNPQDILKLLNSHVVSQRIEVKDIKTEKEYVTLSGTRLVIKYNNDKYFLNGKEISSVENPGKDGIFYILDFVIGETTTSVQPDVLQDQKQ